MKLPLASIMGNCASTIPPLLLPTYIPPFFLPAKSALLQRGSLQPGPDGSPVLRLTFPSFVVATQYNNGAEDRKNEMEDGGKRSLRVRGGDGEGGDDEAVDHGLRVTGNRAKQGKRNRESQK